MEKKRQVFLAVEYQLINIDGIRKHKAIVRQIEH